MRIAQDPASLGTRYLRLSIVVPAHGDEVKEGLRINTHSGRCVLRMEKVQPVLSPMRVLVTDGQERASLAVTRALGQAGAVVIIGAENVHSLASASRFCRGEWQYPSPLGDQAKFIASIKQAIEQWQISHVIAVTDSTIQALSERKADFGSAGCTLPPWDAYNLVSDKYRLMQLAKQLDVPIPDTLFVPDGNAAAVVERIASFLSS